MGYLQKVLSFRRRSIKLNGTEVKDFLREGDKWRESTKNQIVVVMQGRAVMINFSL